MLGNVVVDVASLLISDINLVLALVIINIQI
jgi:hypothetical protein